MQYTQKVPEASPTEKLIAEIRNVVEVRFWELKVVVTTYELRVQYVL
jgi:hypothetical protein